jgi:hypothetical protein
VGATKYPKRIWGAEKKVASLSGLLQRLLPESGSPSLTDVIAVHASCPFILGLPPSARDGGNDVESIASDLCVGDDDFDDEDDEDEGGGEGRSALERSFLHLAYNSNEPGLFETSLGRAILNFKWEAYGKRVLLTQATVFAFQLASVVFQVRPGPPPQVLHGWFELLAVFILIYSIDGFSIEDSLHYMKLHDVTLHCRWWTVSFFRSRIILLGNYMCPNLFMHELWNGTLKYAQENLLENLLC